jgi:RNase adaptor protein for sRNA GlmZ degradation
MLTGKQLVVSQCLEGQKARNVQLMRSAAVMVGKIATGEIKDTVPTPESEGKNPAAVALGRMGGKARAEGLSAKKRKQIAKRAAKARWAER